jgi:hypothetical protein
MSMIGRWIEEIGLVSKIVAPINQAMGGQCSGCPQAAAIYRGDLLSDVSLEDSSDFESRSLARRSYLQRRAPEALSTLTEEAIDRRQYDCASQAEFLSSFTKV